MWSQLAPSQRAAIMAVMLAAILMAAVYCFVGGMIALYVLFGLLAAAGIYRGLMKDEASRKVVDGR